MSLTVITTPEQDPASTNLRMLQATAPFVAGEIHRHKAERLARFHPDYTIEQALLLSDESQVPGDPETSELSMALAEAGYGWSPFQIITKEVRAEMAEYLKDCPDAKAEAADVEAGVGNALVETGLEEYDAALTEVLQPEYHHRVWKNMWVGEEYPHPLGLVLFMEAADYTDMGEFYQRTQGYHRKGLTLRFPTPAHAFAYPAIQEPATKMTHTEWMKTLPKAKDSIVGKIGRKMIGNVISDEYHHEVFDVNMVRHWLESDPEFASAMVIALGDSAMGFAMPGMESDIPGREETIEAYYASGIFTLGRIARKVIIPAIGEEDVYGWNIPELEGLSPEAEKVREDMLKFVGRLEKNRDNEVRLTAIMRSARRQYGQLA